MEHLANFSSFSFTEGEYDDGFWRTTADSAKPLVISYMDRRYGGDPLAPPRPPKLLPRVHRPRAPEPSIMSVPLHSTINVIQQQHHQQQHHHHQQPPPLPPPPTNVRITTPVAPSAVISHQAPQLPPHNSPPITAPLISIHSSTSFSRRRPPTSVISIPTISSVSSNLQNFDASPISPVTLAAPRPENERLGNEYVDTPFRTPNQVSRLQQDGGQHLEHPHGTPNSALTAGSHHHNHHHSHHHHQPHGLGSPKPFVPSGSTSSTTTTTTAQPTVTALPTTAASIRAAVRPNQLPVTTITKQPMYNKDVPAMHHDDIDLHPSNSDTLSGSGSGGFITCPQCNECRCEECQRPRQLPSRWVCDDTCLCSAETIIDYSSCLCCVKALFYHCSKDHEMERDGDSISCADDPCSCVPYKRTQRWAWLGALSLVLPCLWCYWPMRGCVALCAQCYARHTRHGCQCPQTKISNGRGVSGGGNAGIGGVSGGSMGTGVGGGIGRTISRTCDHTPNKRLLDTE